jgi:putative DNA primase/helicase
VENRRRDFHFGGVVMKHNHTDLNPLRTALAHRAADLAVALLGSPNPKIKTKGELRYGNHGSFSVTITGPKAGVWCDNESGEGGDMLSLIMHTHGCKFPDAPSYARDFCGGMELSPAVARHSSEPDGDPIKAAANIKRRVSDAWNEAVDARGTLVEIYLESRELRLPDSITHDVTRFHPALYYDGDNRRVPAMVALYRDIVTDKPTAISRTFLTSDGTKINRGFLGPNANCAIKLSPAHGDELCIGEGIETCIAGMMLGFTPMWATGSAGTISTFPVLPGVKRLTILTDNDKINSKGKTPGQTAARVCSQRWTEAGCEVRRIVPNVIGEDIADIVQRQAITPAVTATPATATPAAVSTLTPIVPVSSAVSNDLSIRGETPNEAARREDWHRRESVILQRRDSLPKNVSLLTMVPLPTSSTEVAA